MFLFFFYFFMLSIGNVYEKKKEKEEKKKRKRREKKRVKMKLINVVLAIMATLMACAMITPVESSILCPAGYVPVNNLCYRCLFGGTYPRCACPAPQRGGYPTSCLVDGKRVLNFETVKPIRG